MIAIVDYGMGNLRSVAKALEYLGGQAIISNKKEDIKSAERIVLPGVGAFGNAMENIRRLDIIETMENEVLDNKKPFLGICLGMQLLGSVGYELGVNKGLGWIPGKVMKIKAEEMGLKVPHVGWNGIKITKESPLLNGITDGTAFYFVHSYALKPDDSGTIVATCQHGEEFAAAIQKGNIFATQFHPEKSQKDGLKVLKNFMEWNK
ncbi:MAG: imidazole glycerol phosphate synthase subunit HisH [Candidatus Micrarchaeia archaeon]